MPFCNSFRKIQNALLNNHNIFKNLQENAHLCHGISDRLLHIYCERDMWEEIVFFSSLCKKYFQHKKCPDGWRFKKGLVLQGSLPATIHKLIHLTNYG